MQPFMKNLTISLFLKTVNSALQWESSLLKYFHVARCGIFGLVTYPRDDISNINHNYSTISVDFK